MYLASLNNDTSNERIINSPTFDMRFSKVSRKLGNLFMPVMIDQIK